MATQHACEKQQRHEEYGVPALQETCHVVCICCGQGFPHGMAQTARIRMVGKALVAGGCRFTVLNIGGGLCPNSTSRGIADGIHFEYLPGRIERPSNRLLRQIVYAQGMLQAARRLHMLRKIERYLCVYSWYPGGTHALFHRYLQFIHCPVVKEENEWFPERSEATLREWNMKLTQGSLAISQPILDRLKCLPSYRPSHRILHVPILVDPEEWRPRGPAAGAPRGDAPYVLWCGNLGCAAEDIEFLLRVVKAVNKTETCRFTLVGTHDAAVAERIYKLADDVGLGRKSVRLPGFVSDDELRVLMHGAAALLLPLWDTERSICRFPTKLGSYLASATPVVATAAGDLVRYLEDGKSACLAAPGAVDEFAAKIVMLLQNPPRAKAIGLAGLEVARKHFSIQANQSQLVRFFSGLAREYGPEGVIGPRLSSSIDN